MSAIAQKGMIGRRMEALRRFAKGYQFAIGLVIVAFLSALISIGTAVRSTPTPDRTAMVATCTPRVDRPTLLMFPCTGNILERAVDNVLTLHPDWEIAAVAPIDVPVVTSGATFGGENTSARTAGYMIAFRAK